MYIACSTVDIIVEPEMLKEYLYIYIYIYCKI